MSKRVAGEGSIFQRRDGRWVASLRSGGQRFTVYDSSAAEAQSKLDQLRQQHRLGVLVKPTRLSLADYMKD